MRHFQQFFSPDENTTASDAKRETVQASQAVSQSAPDSRRYREDVPYILPKDLGEQERLNFQHTIFRSALQGNYVAPLGRDLTHILDVGSGSGIWGYEIALQFPAASVFGVDLEPPTETTSLPPNYHFVQSNVLQRLPFTDNTFDFTHQRLLRGAIPALEWPHVIQELVRVTRPGGWIELFEMGGSISNAGPATELLHRWERDICLSRGIDISKAEEIGTMLTQAGLRRVTQRSIDLPIGAWDTQVGVLMEKNGLLCYRALKPIICKLAHIDSVEFEQHMSTALQEWNQQHACTHFYLAYGQVE